MSGFSSPLSSSMKNYRIRCLGLDFLEGADLVGLVDEDIDKDDKDEEGSNAPAQVKCLRLSSHPEGGSSPEHVEVREEPSQHIIINILHHMIL